MNVIEARRVRHLILRIDRGEELPGALLRALDQAEARAGWIQGIGSLEAAEIALFDQASKTYGRTRRIDTQTDVLALSGNVSLHEGAGLLRMSATLARETETGLEVFGGELVWARAFAIELHIVVFDDIALARSLDERTGLALLVPRALAETGRAAGVPMALSTTSTTSATGAPGAPGAPTAVYTPSATETARIQPSTAPAASAAPAPPGADPSAPALPARPVRPRDDVETYPEVGDLVSHFHFGECTVISSDGDRIRLRQERDGRMREVSLTMLRIEPPTVDPASGKRHFRLARKN